MTQFSPSAVSTGPGGAAVPLTRRAQLRRDTLAEITSRARQQLAEHGPGGLSLRAIAREMRMSSSAMYRYYTSVNDLITALILDAYDSLAEAVTTGRDSRPADDPAGRWWAVCHGFRRWALDHRADFALIFGTPLPGYDAPEQSTGQAAGRSIVLALSVYAAAVASGAADPDRSQVPDTVQTGELLPVLLAAAPQLSPRLAAITLSAYTSLLGFVTGEIFGSLTRLVADTTGLYAAHVRTVMLGMGFDPDLVAAVT